VATIGAAGVALVSGALPVVMTPEEGDGCSSMVVMTGPLTVGWVAAVGAATGPADLCDITAPKTATQVMTMSAHAIARRRIGNPPTTSMSSPKDKPGRRAAPLPQFQS
jgi:hypothetical protein